MLRAAMAAERSTAARHTEDPFADLGVSFKEVRLVRGTLTLTKSSISERFIGLKRGNLLELTVIVIWCG